MFCPNYKNNEVFTGFNEIIEALGGTPMTEEEFRSSELRNQREGLDYSAMEAAYKIWHRNGGNTIDKAPNGQTSILFQTLLGHFNGDRQAAIQAKSKVYSDNFINWFGDWEKYAPKSDASERLLKKLNSIANSKSRFAVLAEVILENHALPYNLKYFKIDNNRDDVEGHAAMWNSLVNLIEVLGNNASEEEINKALLHELIHYNTEELLSAYKDSPNSVSTNIRENIKELYSIIEYAKKYLAEHFDEKKFREIAERQNKDIGSRVFYAFDNQGDVEIDEFISEIFTNPGLQEILNEIPYKETKQTLWDKIKEAIQSIFNIDINQGSVLEEALKVSTEFITKAIYKYDPVSKVVDENGEPLVVYHHSDDPNLTEFSSDFENYFTKDGGTKEAIFFDEEKTGTLNRKYDLPVFLNIRELNEYNETKQQLHDRGTTYREIVNESARKNSKIGGVHMKDFDDNKKEHQSIWIIHNPNQVKSATDNNGDFSTEDNNINNLQIPQNTPFSTFNFSKIINSYQKLQNRETISSDELISELLSNEDFSGIQLITWKLLSTLNIPIRFSNNLPELKFGRAAYDENGNSIVELNGELIAKLPAYEVYHGIMHELIHSKTSYILDNPSTELESNFAQTTKAVYQSLLQKIDSIKILPFLPTDVRYALINEKEFASELISSDSVRQELFDLAKIIDNKNSNRFINGVKRLINNAVNVLFNKSVFNTTEQQLKDYIKQFKQYLTDTEHQRQKSFTKQELEALYNSLDQNAVETSQQVSALDNIHKNARIYNIDELTITPSQIKRKYSPQSILDQLTLRLVAIQTRDLNASLKTKAISDTEKQISALENSQTPLYVQITILTDYIQTQIKEYIQKLNAVLNEGESMDFAELQFINRDTLNIYSSIMRQINRELTTISSAQKIAEEYNESRLGQNISSDDVLMVKSIVENCIMLLQNGKDIAANVIENFGIQTIEKIGTDVGDPTIQKHIEDYNLHNQFEDTGSIWLWLGSAEFSNNATVKAITHIIGQANRTSEKLAKEALFEGLEIFKQLKTNQKMSDVYERDNNGRYTQYLIRDLNFGEFYKRYDEELIKINKKLGLPLKNRIAPGDPELKVKFNKMRNKWLSNNCHRKYINEYYDAWDEVPVYVRERMLMLNQQIDDLFNTYNIRDEEGYADFSKLPEDAYKLARRLIQSKRALRSPYNEYGRKKQQGDPDYENLKVHVKK